MMHPVLRSGCIPSLSFNQQLVPSNSETEFVAQEADEDQDNAQDADVDTARPEPGDMKLRLCRNKPVDDLIDALYPATTTMPKIRLF